MPRLTIAQSFEVKYSMDIEWPLVVILRKATLEKLVLLEEYIENKIDQKMLSNVVYFCQTWEPLHNPCSCCC